jgi:hypothetical protein
VGSDFAQPTLHFRPGRLDRIEIGRIRRQVAVAKALFSELGSSLGGNERAGCCQQSLKDQG